MNFLRYFKSLDAYPKTATEYRETTRYGGCLTILGCVLVFWLATVELVAFLDVKTIYDANIDTDRSVDQSVMLNFDISIASRCEYISADVIDVAGAHVGELEHSLMRQPVEWSVSPPDNEHVNSFWKETSQPVLNELHDILMSMAAEPKPDGESNSKLPFATLASRLGLSREHSKRGASEPLPIVKTAREGQLATHDAPEVPAEALDDAVVRAPAELNACRIYGTLPVAKVQGNFHITAGRSVEMNGMHGHDVSSVPMGALNFTHKIHRLSFGENWAGLAAPLDSVVQHTDAPLMSYFYALKVVPTIYTEEGFGYARSVRTNQYSATFRAVPIADGMRSLPGLFFNFNFEAVRILVHESSPSLTHFVTRMLAIFGGVFACARMLASYGHTATDFFDRWSRRAITATNAWRS